MDAPPTNPEADRSDDVAEGGRPPVAPPAADTPHGDRGAPDGARDAWIRAQRPPHWD